MASSMYKLTYAQPPQYSEVQIGRRLRLGMFGHVSSRAYYARVLLSGGNWTKCTMFVYKGMRAYCFINIKTHNQSGLWDGIIRLCYSSVLTESIVEHKKQLSKFINLQPTLK